MYCKIPSHTIESSTRLVKLSYWLYDKHVYVFWQVADAFRIQDLEFRLSSPKLGAYTCIWQNYNVINYSANNRETSVYYNNLNFHTYCSYFIYTKKQFWAYKNNNGIIRMQHFSFWKFELILSNTSQVLCNEDLEIYLHQIWPSWQSQIIFPGVIRDALVCVCVFILL